MQSNSQIMNASGLRRNIKNIVHNYSDAQIKVREATSNDPWGPSSTLMSEIADLTYNVVAFSEIMQMIWKRLNDHGKNWRHVYKALVLLEYLIKTGTEKVAQQCKENIFAIQTLKDFQHIEDNKDQGMNVREKAKQLVSLLKDDERLKNERARALKAKERFAQATSGIGSDACFNAPFPGRGDSYNSNGAGSPSGCVLPELESARPQTAGEEELQLQLALAMSKEEAEQEEQRRRSDDVRLQMAITQSQEDFKKVQDDPHPKNQSALLDLLDVSASSTASSRIPAGGPTSADPWGMPLQKQSTDLWVSPIGSRPATTSPPPDDPWAPKPASRSNTPVSKAGTPTSSRLTQAMSTVQPIQQPDPWSNPVSVPAAPDPWGAAAPAVGSSGGNAFGSTPSLATNGDIDGFDLLSSRAAPSKSTNNLDLLGSSSPNPFDMNSVQQNLPKYQPAQSIKKTPESFLGENSALVNLDALVSLKAPEPVGATMNPFATTSSSPNPFQMAQNQRISINQLRSQQQFNTNPSPSSAFSGNTPGSTPLMISANQGMQLGGDSQMTSNPFL